MLALARHITPPCSISAVQLARRSRLIRIMIMIKIISVFTDIKAVVVGDANIGCMGVVATAITEGR